MLNVKHGITEVNVIRISSEFATIKPFTIFRRTVKVDNFKCSFIDDSVSES